MARRRLKTRYAFLFEPEPVPDMSKQEFIKKYGITPPQAYTFVKNEQGEIEGIVFQGYRSRIDKQLERKEYSWDTEKKVDVKKLHKGMTVYVLETDYDADTNERIEKPKLRIVGRLKEVWRVQKKKLFP
ncbi:MAG: hypothetical protein QW506_02760 [Thermoproteota archaeon]